MDHLFLAQPWARPFTYIVLLTLGSKIISLILVGNRGLKRFKYLFKITQPTVEV